MSLTMMALRISAVQALRAAGTLVGDNVLDSQISAFDQTADGRLRSDQQRPFIAVYTDAAKAADLGQTGLRANGRVDIMFNCGVSLTMAQTDKETGESVVEGFPATDDHFEAILDVLDAQVARALTDPNNAWAQVFGDFVQAYVSKEHIRSSSSVENVRLAAGQTKITVEVFADPHLGASFTASSPWVRFMALMQEHEVPQLAMFQALFGQPAIGLYAEFEKLTSMSARDAKTLKLYSFGGAPLSVVLTDMEADYG